MLWASCCSQYSVHQGGKKELLGAAWLGFHFVMWCLFFFYFWADFSLEATSPFTPIYYFLHSGSWWIWISVSKLRVCAFNACIGVASSFSLCVCVWGSNTFMAVSDLCTSRFGKARKPGGRERERWLDNGNGGWKKANTIFNEFPWLSLPVSGSESPGRGCGWTEDYRAEKNRPSQGLLK